MKISNKFLRWLFMFLPIFLIFLFIYPPWHEFSYSDRFVQESLENSSFMKTTIELNLVLKLVDEIAKIPTSLNYRKICFYNNGNPDVWYSTGEYLVITPISGDMTSLSNEILIPYHENYCIIFKGDSYSYKWGFIHNFDLCNESCMAKHSLDSLDNLPKDYIPQKYDHVDLILKESPNMQNFNQSRSSFDYTNIVIKSEPYSVLLKFFIVSIAWMGIILFLYKVKDFLIA